MIGMNRPDRTMQDIVYKLVPGLFNSKLGYTYVPFFYAYVYLQPSRYGESSSMLSEASLIQVSHATSVV